MLHSLYLLTLTENIYVYGVLDLPDSLPDSTKVSGVVGKPHTRRENLRSGGKSQLKTKVLLELEPKRVNMVERVKRLTNTRRTMYGSHSARFLFHILRPRLGGFLVPVYQRHLTVQSDPDHFVSYNFPVRFLACLSTSHSLKATCPPHSPTGRCM